MSKWYSRSVVFQLDKLSRQELYYYTFYLYLLFRLGDFNSTTIVVTKSTIYIVHIQQKDKHL